jgi:plasmid replication initiation protein
MDRCLEVFQIDRFREMIGVPPGAYENGTNFMNKVVTPALLEVNGLSDMGVAVQLNRRHARAPIDSVTVTWWRKGPEELTEVLAERNRSKLGRMERLKVTQQLETPRAVTTA